jgi:hypothetical protein
VVIGLLSVNGFAGNASKNFVAYGTPFAYIIINIMFIAGYVLDEVISKRVVSFIFYLLNLAALL